MRPFGRHPPMATAAAVSPMTFLFNALQVAPARRGVDLPHTDEGKAPNACLSPRSFPQFSRGVQMNLLDWPNSSTIGAPTPRVRRRAHAGPCPARLYRGRLVH